MKLINKYIGIGFLSILAIACTDDFDKLNTNPNQPSADNPATESVLASSMRKAFHEDRFEFWRGVVLHAERFAGHVEGGYSGCWWSGASSYDYSEGWTAGVWDAYNAASFNGYGGSLFANLKVIMNYYESTPDALYAKEFLGISETLRAFQFLKLTDLFGDVPYSQHGNIDIASPEFDNQQAIYDDLEVRLRKVVEEYLVDDVTIGTMQEFDLVYSGNVAKWRKFANSLRLRMALRRSNVDEAGAKAILAEVVKYPLLEGNGDNVKVERTQSSVDLQNQYYGFFKTWPGSMTENYTWDGYTLSWGVGPGAFIPAYEIVEIMKGSPLYAAAVKDGGSATEDINALSGIADPRMDKYFMRPKGDVNALHKGMPARSLYFLKNGKITTINSDAAGEGDVHQYSWLHPSIWYDGGTWSPVSLDYAEVCLAMSEAVQRNLVSSGKSTAQWLEEGLSASCNRWGAEAGSFPGDVVAKFNSATAAEKIAIIDTERWISAYTVPHQAYAVLRRTGHPEYQYLNKDMKITGTWENPDGSTETRSIERYAPGSTNFVLPQRMRIPESEVAVNANVPEENKSMSNKVWWAK